MRTVSILKITASLLLGILLLGPAAGAAPVAAATPTATPTATPRPCTNAAQFVEDVTIPDNTILRGGASFVKTWRFKNTGTCTWSTGYKLMRDTGAALGGPASVTLLQAVVSNGAVDISVPLAAPYAPGIYKGYWQPADAGGRLFGPKVSVVIVVPNPALGEELPDTAIFWAGGGGGDRTVKGLCAVGYPDAKAPQVRVTPVESWTGRAGHAGLYLWLAGGFYGPGHARQPDGCTLRCPVRCGRTRPVERFRTESDAAGRGDPPQLAGQHG